MKWETKGVWALETEVPQRGPGAVQVLVWGKHHRNFRYNVMCLCKLSVRHLLVTIYHARSYVVV